MSQHIRTNKAKSARKALTLIELLIVTLFLGILAFVAVPKMQVAILDRYQNKTLAQKIVTDLCLARNMAVTDAARNTSGFAVQMVGTSPYRNYNITNLATGEVISSHTIASTVSCTGGSLFKFGPLGNLLTGSGTQLLISAGGKTSTINIVAATGAVKHTSN
jgi:Tfp pilus assembly protein FimT